MSRIPVAEAPAEVRKRAAAWRKDGAGIALIPTMGALHEGHLSHIAHARARAARVVVSIFVNPAQFAPQEDFARYPRDLAGDLAKLERAGGVDLVYAPAAAEMYPDGFDTRLVVGGAAAGLESEFRPHFFSGVATVVAKLLIQVSPDIATFGEKDYQQLLVVKRLVRDLDFSVDIIPVPILREPDGLALSSRNAYLSPAERKIAPALHSVLRSTAGLARSGHGIPESEAEGAAALLTAGFARVDYVAIRDAATLQPLRDVKRPARVLAAAWLGKTRLIDNLAV